MYCLTDGDQAFMNAVNYKTIDNEFEMARYHALSIIQTESVIAEMDWCCGTAKRIGDISMATMYYQYAEHLYWEGIEDRVGFEDLAPDYVSADQWLQEHAPFFRLTTRRCD